MKKLFLFLFFILFSVIAMEMPEKEGKKEEKVEVKTKQIPSLKQKTWKIVEPKIIAELYPQLEASDLATIKEYLQDTTGKLLLGSEWAEEHIDRNQIRDLVVALAYKLVLGSTKLTVTEKQEIIDAILGRRDLEAQDLAMLKDFLHDRIFEEVKQGNPQAIVTTQSDLSGYTMLHLASLYKDGSYFMQVLLNHGAQVDAKNSQGLTPLLTAVYNDEELEPHLINEMIKILLHAGADVNAIDPSIGSTPLAVAILGLFTTTDINTIKLFLSANADLTKQTEGPLISKLTILHLAVVQTNAEIVKIILQALQEKKLLEKMINAQDSLQRTPLHATLTAFEFQYQELQRTFKKQKMNEDEKQQELQLFFDIYKDIIELLLKAGASITAENRQGKTPEDLVLLMSIPDEVKLELFKMVKKK